MLDYVGVSATQLDSKKVTKKCFLHGSTARPNLRDVILGSDSHRAFTIWQDAFSVLAPALPLGTQLQYPKLAVKTCPWEFPRVLTTCLEDNCIYAHMSNNPYAASDAFETC